MVGLGPLEATQRLFPQVGAEIVNQIGKMPPVERPDRLALEGSQKPQFQTEPGVLAALDLCAIGVSLRRFMDFARHFRPAIGAGYAENRKVLFCLIFNIHPIVPAAVPALVMHIVAVDRPILSHPVAAAETLEIALLSSAVTMPGPWHLGHFT